MDVKVRPVLNAHGDWYWIASGKGDGRYETPAECSERYATAREALESARAAAQAILAFFDSDAGRQALEDAKSR